MNGSVAPPSWHHLTHEAPGHRLPDALRQRDPRGAVDCGWVEQMHLLVEQFSSREQRVLDPFAGFGTTLVACALAGRASLGIEREEGRVALVRERMALYPAARYDVLCGDARELSAPDASVDLILTNLPYFELAEDPDDGRLDAAYAAHLAMLDAAFARQRRAMKDGALCVAAVQNLRVGGRFVPFAWDVARVLATHLTLCDEQILVYDRARPASPDVTATNRAHEYLLVARRDGPALDVEDALAVLRDLAAVGRLAVTGGLALLLVAPEALDRPPSDADVLVPETRDALDPLVARLLELGFAVTSWGEPVTRPLVAAQLDGRIYLRAIRGGLTLDLTFAAPALFEDLWQRRSTVRGMPVLDRADLRRQLEVSARPRDRARARALFTR